MRRIDRMFSALVLSSVLVFAAPVGAAPEGGVQLDWAMLGCQLVEGPGPDSLTLLLTVALIESPDAGQFPTSIDILFNGQPYDSHPIIALPMFLRDCPQAAGCPPPTPPPCGRTAYGYKNVVWEDAWRCLFHQPTMRCNCVKPGQPVPHEKRIPKPPNPPLDSFFDVFVDIGNLVPETNENNNRCTVPYNASTPIKKRAWGTVKILYR